MQQLNRGDVIEYYAPQFLFDNTSMGSSLVMLLILRAAESSVVRVRVIRVFLEDAWVAVPKGLFAQQFILPLEPGIAYTIVPRDQVLQRCDKTDGELSILTEEKWIPGRVTDNR